MIGRMIGALAGSALALCVAQPAHALECEPGETLVRESAWRGQPLSAARLLALPGRALVWWQSDTVKSALVEGGAVTAQPALGALSGIVDSTVVSTTDVTLVVGRTFLDGLVAQRLSADGSLLGGPHRLADGQDYARVSAASDGARFLVAWTEAEAAGGPYRVRAATIAPDGVASAARDLGSTARGFGVHAVHTGDVTWVIWSGSPTGENDGIFGLRLDNDGAPLDDAPLRLGGDSHVVTAVSLGDHAMLAVNGSGPRNLIPLDADGIAGDAVDLQDLVGDQGFVALTPRPGGDDYLVWTSPSLYLSGSFPALPEELHAYAVRRDGTVVDGAPFTIVTGADPTIAFDGTAVRYAHGDDSGADGISRIRTGTIAASGALHGIVVDEERLVFESWERCAAPPPPDPYEGCCSTSPGGSGATTAGLVLLATLAAVARRRSLSDRPARSPSPRRPRAPTPCAGRARTAR